VTTYTKQTDTVHKIKLESHLIYALWSYNRAFAGEETELEVRTSLVGNGAKIKITCKTEKGKKLGKVEGTIFDNRFKGKVLIPENCKPNEMIYFEAELPKHGLKDESNSIPVRPQIVVTKMQWDRQEVKRKDAVKITCQFKNGMEDGDDAMVIIYEHNPNSSDLKVASIPTIIKDNKIEMQWEFDYHDHTSLIPTDDELKPYEKKYANPQFFFVIVIDGVCIGEKMESGLMEFKDFVEFILQSEAGVALPNHDVNLYFADGSQQKAKSDENGVVSFTNISAGEVTVEIPD
jgi:hypothetical protein